VNVKLQTELSVVKVKNTRDKFAIDSYIIMLADTGANTWMSRRATEPAVIAAFL
jgi:hypothetical protein